MNRRRCSFALCLAVLACYVIGWVRRADAQLFERSVALQNARIITLDGYAIENGTLLIGGEKIAALGAQVNVPLLATRVDLEGATVTPGLIDCWSAWAETAGSAADPNHRAEDAFNRYDTHNLQDLLAGGVTSLYVSPARGNGVSGCGAVIRLTPGDDRDAAFGQVLASEAALSIDLGASGKPIARLKILQAVQKLFDDAIEHRRKQEEYDEKLEEYAKQLQEAADKKQAAEKAKPKPKPTAAEEDKKDEGTDAAKKEEEKKPAKPPRPPRNPKLEIMLKAMDRELPVRIVAHRSDEIVNALELAEQFSLDLIIEGATEAHLVAEQLAQADALVVLGSRDWSARPANDVYRRAARDQAARLTAAGVRWVIGSGSADPLRSRFLLQNVQLAASGPALARVTSEAADALRVDDRIGRLRPGMLADLVVWSGDPLDPASRVLRVYVGGELAYLAPPELLEGDAS